MGCDGGVVAAPVPRQPTPPSRIANMWFRESRGADMNARYQLTTFRAVDVAMLATGSADALEPAA